MEQPTHSCLRERNQSERLHAGQAQLVTPLRRSWEYVSSPRTRVTLWTGVNKCVGAPYCNRAPHWLTQPSLAVMTRRGHPKVPGKWSVFKELQTWRVVCAQLWETILILNRNFLKITNDLFYLWALKPWSFSGLLLPSSVDLSISTWLVLEIT